MIAELDNRIQQQEIAETIARKLLEFTQYPQFGIGGVPVKVAAKVYGKSEMWVRTGIVEGWLNIGHATSSDKRTNLYISPKKLWEDTGYIWTGR